MPCMDVLHLFTASNVPAMAPEEEFAPLINSTEPTPVNLSGNGLVQHPMLYIGENCNRIFLVKDGKITPSFLPPQNITYACTIGSEVTCDACKICDRRGYKIAKTYTNPIIDDGTGSNGEG